jgi:hypothetical protein
VQTRFLVRAAIRIAFAVTGVVAMTYQFTRLQRHPTFNPGNFFSFFTIRSNILAVVMLVLTALIRTRRAATAVRRPTRRRNLLHHDHGRRLRTAVVRSARAVGHALRVRQLRRALSDPRRAHRRLGRRPAPASPGIEDRDRLACLSTRVARIHPRAWQRGRLVPVPICRRLAPRLRRRAPTGPAVSSPPSQRRRRRSRSSAIAARSPACSRHDPVSVRARGRVGRAGTRGEGVPCWLRNRVIGGRRGVKADAGAGAVRCPP